MRLISVLLVALPLALGDDMQTALQSRDRVLADGSKMFEGNINGFEWQATGVLKQGCPSSVHIKDCYDLELTNNPKKQLDPKHLDQPRQRIEFANEGVADGITATYKWKYYLFSKTKTTKTFFHLMQLLTHGGTGGPVITLDAVAGVVAVKDHVRDCSKTHCPSIPLAQFTDRTTEHTLTFTAGSKGKMQYLVKNADTGATLLSYSASGNMGTKRTGVKFGTYRGAVTGMSASSAALGDFTYHESH
ncbi:hypothetical protein OE88DRAFT_412188 [Heliocybe sulcata]|uniref:Polysaccharide lyase family 7 protein n=1 Tax=Heliocybe sulcata TaxID=5364 RepID=A0A5C3MYS3_9AGAM|nr:hypothetical protein OE88DRAFT_412188 [Heliocybe sulcata]